MKWLFIVIVVALLASFLWPVEPDSYLYAVRGQVVDQFKYAQKSIKWSIKSEQEKKEFIAVKREELRAYENALQQMEADIVRMQSEIPVCPITGQQSKLNLTQDPQPELKLKIEQLKVEISQLESKQ